MFCIHAKLKRNCVLCMQRESLQIQQAQLQMARANFAREQQERKGTLIPVFDMPEPKRRRPHIFRWIVVGIIALVIASDRHISPFVGPAVVVAIVVWGLWLWRRFRGDGISLADEDPAPRSGRRSSRLAEEIHDGKDIR